MHTHAHITTCICTHACTHTRARAPPHIHTTQGTYNAMLALSTRFCTNLSPSICPNETTSVTTPLNKPHAGSCNMRMCGIWGRKLIHVSATRRRRTFAVEGHASKLIFDGDVLSHSWREAIPLENRPTAPRSSSIIGCQQGNFPATIPSTTPPLLELRRWASSSLGIPR